VSSNHVLRTENLSKRWGRIYANKDLSVSFPVGIRHALIGPNGAGKTTFVNLLTGAYAPTAGAVFLGDENITTLPQHERVKRGMTRTFQINTLFAGLTVLESVLLAIFERKGMASAWHVSVASRADEIREARGLLARLHLEAEAGAVTRHLPYGKQRLLEIALALASQPKILVLDEPASGIPGTEIADVFSVIAALPSDVTILFVEHDMDLVFRFAQRISVLSAGELLAEGTPEEISANQRVREVYLGEAHPGEADG
jgi:branched-chain amino acid transport system ATP-binding protein